MAHYVLGDVHGDRPAVWAFLDAVGYNPDTDRVSFTGDMGDRGHDTKGVLDDAMRFGWDFAQGNHDNKLYRASLGNPVKRGPELQDTIDQLGDEWATKYGPYLGAAPLFIKVESAYGDGYIVHAGVSPDRPLESDDPTVKTQDKKMLLMGRTFPFEIYIKGQAPTAKPWQDSYKGHLGYIFHGHHVHENVQSHGNPLVYSLDGGSVFGGVMRGINLDTMKVTEVPGSPEAFAHYKEVWGGELDLAHIG